MTVEPAPDRQAPIAPASRAAATSRGSCGKTLRPVRLVEAVDGQDPQQVEAPDRDARRRRSRRRVRLATASARGTFSGSTFRMSVGREAQLGDEEHGPQVARRVEPERLDPPSIAALTTNPPSSAAAALSGWPSIAVARRSRSGLVSGSPRSALPATSPATVAAADDPRPRASGISLCISIRQPTPSGISPRTSRSAASIPWTQRFSRSAGSSPSPSPSTVSSISPRLQPRTSTSTRFVRPERDREAVVAGAEVRARCRHLDDRPAARRARPASSSPSEGHRNRADRRLGLEHRTGRRRPPRPSPGP